MDYLTPQQVIEFNVIALQRVAAKKKDRHEVRYYSKIAAATDLCKRAEGDIYDKAAVLLETLVQAHAFASGNRRTAVAAAISFLEMNEASVPVPDPVTTTRLLKGVREGFYNRKHITQWLRTGSFDG